MGHACDQHICDVMSDALARYGCLVHNWSQTRAETLHNNASSGPAGGRAGRGEAGPTVEAVLPPHNQGELEGVASIAGANSNSVDVRAGL